MRIMCLWLNPDQAHGESTASAKSNHSQAQPSGSTPHPPAGSVLRNSKEEIHQLTWPGTPPWPHGPRLALSRFLAFTPSALLPLGLHPPTTIHL